jgi:hypothetical protein
LETAREEAAALEHEAKEIEERLEWIRQRLSNLQAYMIAVRPLIEDDPGSEAARVGLTHMCRELLAKNGRWMTAAEMRLLLAAVGIDLTPYTNPMAVLHSVLGRVGKKHRAADGTLHYAGHDVPGFLESPEVNPQISPMTILGRYGGDNPPPPRITPEMLAGSNRQAPRIRQSTLDRMKESESDKGKK